MIDIEELIEIHNKEDNQTSGETWKALRQAILERDNYTCQECEAKATTVHHKEYGSIGSFDLVSVCPKCHMRLHGLNPELIGFVKREINWLERRIAEVKSYVEAIEKHYVMPPRMLARDKWEGFERARYIEDIRKMETRLREIKEGSRKYQDEMRRKEIIRVGD